MEKLNEIKETYAKELGYKDWETCINDQPNYKVETLMDEVALRLYSVSTRFSPAIAEMKEAIIDDLKELSKGYGKYKKYIAKDTGIPVDILTVLLKQLKIEGKIELIMIWSESTGMPNGSGYCLTGNLTY